MYFTRILLSIVFVVFASTALAVKPKKTITPDRNTFTESAPVAAVNVEPARDAGDCEAGRDFNGVGEQRGTKKPRRPSFVGMKDKKGHVTTQEEDSGRSSGSGDTEMPKTQGMNVSSRMVALRASAEDKGEAATDDRDRCSH